MKKTIIVEFLLLFVFAVLLYFCICHLLMFSDLVKIYNSNDKTLSFAEEFGYSELIKGIITQRLFPCRNYFALHFALAQCNSVLLFTLLRTQIRNRHSQFKL